MDGTVGFPSLEVDVDFTREREREREREGTYLLPRNMRAIVFQSFNRLSFQLLARAS
jgi:hypothetical protein